MVPPRAAHVHFCHRRNASYETITCVLVSPWTNCNWVIGIVCTTAASLSSASRTCGVTSVNYDFAEPLARAEEPSCVRAQATCRNVAGMFDFFTMRQEGPE